MKYKMDESMRHEKTEKVKGKAEMMREYGMGKKKTKTKKRTMKRMGEKMPFGK